MQRKRTDGGRRAEMTEQQEQMIFNEGYRRGKADRPRGKWEEINVKEYKALCSNCGTWSVVMGNFCPNCGADMRGEDDEAD